MLYSLFEEIWEKKTFQQNGKNATQSRSLRKAIWVAVITSEGSHYCQYLEIILERMKGEVDKTLREEQADFRRDRSYTDQIATLLIIVEQSIEWNSSVYVNCVDSLDIETHITSLRHYGVPMQLVNMIKNSYEGMSCRVIQITLRLGQG